MGFSRRAGLTMAFVCRDLRSVRPLTAMATGKLAIHTAEYHSIMLEEFDPYSQWLGILAHERPVDHYRLLGIARFTSDPAVITAAADRRMAMIRSYQTGPRGRFTQPLLNEIAGAKLCLINSPSRTAYDAMLEGLTMATAPPPLAPPPVQPAPPASLPQAEASESREPPTALVGEDEVAADVWESEESLGLSVGWAMLALVLVAAVGSYLTWHLLDANRRPPAIDPQVALEDGRPRQETKEDKRGSSSRGDEPVVVIQETDGGVNFTPAVAVLSGDSVRLESDGITDLLTGWTTVDDAAVWKCKIVKLPPSGVFRVLVTYRASTEANEGTFQLAINAREKTCQMRGTGEFLTDEYFLAVTRTGEQSLELRSLQSRGGDFALKGIRLVMPQGGE